MTRSSGTDHHKELNETISYMGADARRIVGDEPVLTTEERLNQILEKVDALEFLAEKVNQRDQLTSEVKDYVLDLKREISDIRIIRNATVIAAWFMVVALFGFVFFLLIWTPQWFADIDGHFQTPLLLTFAGGAIFLFSLILRGTFQSRADRNTGGLLPDHIKQILESLKQI